VPRQLSFLPKIRLDHGGATAKGRRKVARPFDPKRPLHLVLKSSRACGSWSLLHPKNAPQVEEILRSNARKHGVRLYRVMNVGNHLHLLVSAKTRTAFQSFLREMAGAVAFRVTGAKKTHPIGGRFWDALAYSRIVTWGREFKALHDYLIKNAFEAAGVWEAGRKLVLIREAHDNGFKMAPGE
jgi:REP element-mobilizing transposase RayT